MTYSRKMIDLTGRRFGFLTALRRDGTRRSPTARIALWRCRCDCGQEITGWSRRLRNGKLKACGIDGHHYRPMKGKGVTEINRSEYRSWRGMWERCNGKDIKSDRNYKARGIKVCARWKSFAAFFADMGSKPSPKHTIDRYPDNNGDYKPENCRWATSKEQTRNMRPNVVIEYQGEKMLLLDVVEKLGLKSGVVNGRLKMGWTLADALSVPIRGKRKNSK